MLGIQHQQTKTECNTVKYNSFRVRRSNIEDLVQNKLNKNNSNGTWIQTKDESSVERQREVCVMSEAIEIKLV